MEESLWEVTRFPPQTALGSVLGVTKSAASFQKAPGWNKKASIQKIKFIAWRDPVLPVIWDSSPTTRLVSKRCKPTARYVLEGGNSTKKLGPGPLETSRTHLANLVPSLTQRLLYFKILLKQANPSRRPSSMLVKPQNHQTHHPKSKKTPSPFFIIVSYQKKTTHSPLLLRPPKALPRAPITSSSTVSLKASTP